MTSAVGGGWESPKSRQKEQNQLIAGHDKEGRGIKNHFANFIWKPPKVRDLTFGRFELNIWLERL